MQRLFLLAARNLLRNRRRTWLTLLALAVGVFAVVGVRGFLNGLQGSLILGITEGSMGAIQIHRRGFLASIETTPLTPNIEWSERLLARIAAVPGVKEVTPRIAFAGMVSVGDETVFAMLTGVDPERELKVCPRRTSALTRGRWLKAGEAESALGMELAAGLHAEPGARTAIISSDVDGVMNAADTTLVAHLAALTQGEKKLLLLPLALAQEILRMPGRVTELAVRVERLDEVEEVALRLSTALGPDYEVHTWKSFATFVKDIQENQNRALDVITSIFLVIILMGIMNTLLMSVLERVREIGTMMAVGAKRRQVLTLFVIEALLLGASGSLLGTGLGYAFVSFLGSRGITLTTPGASLPQLLIPEISVGFLARLVILCMVGAAISALYPAWKAARLRPVEALAHV